MNGITWTREEAIAAFALYCITPSRKMRVNNPMLLQAAEKIHHSIDSLVMYLRNFLYLDENTPEVGCTNTSQLQQKIYEEFKHDWFTLSCMAEEYLGFELFSDDNTIPIAGAKPISSLTERSRTNKERSIFRTEVFTAYDGKCCITGIDIPELLIASHIKDFSKSPKFQRIAPTNGLLLNSFHDALFDKGFITVRPDYTIQVSNHIKQHVNTENAFARKWILELDGCGIALPEKFKPDKDCLSWHNTHKFKE